MATAAFDALDAACETDLNDCLESHNELKDLLKAPPQQVDEKNFAACIKDVDNKLNLVKKSRRSCGVELTQIKDRALRNDKADRVKYFDEQIQAVTSTLQKAKLQQQRFDLLKDSRTNNNQYSTEGKTNDELLDATNKVQDKTFESLGRTKMLIEQSKDVGTATIEELKRQWVQMQDIEDDIDKLESNVERAEQLVINFTRRMASDKIIQFFMVFNIVIVIIIVIYASVTGKSLTSKSKHGSSSDFFGTHAPTVQPTSFAPTTS
jgi:archaellum component FlaC